MEKWLETDEYGEIVSSLRSCLHFVKLAETDLTYWKWIYCAVHNAVQGTMVVALTRTDSLGPYVAPYEIAMLKFYEDRRTDPAAAKPQEKPTLLKFMDLFKKIKKKGMIQSFQIERFSASKTHRRSMNRLNDLRNEFIHFDPKGWSLEILGYFFAVRDCLSVSRFLAEHCDRFSTFLHYKEGQIESLIDELIVALDHLETSYRSEPTTT